MRLSTALSVRLLASETALPIDTAYVGRITTSGSCEVPDLPIHVGPGKLLVLLPPRASAMSVAIDQWRDICKQIGVLVACSQRLDGRTDLPTPAAPAVLENKIFSTAEGGPGVPALGFGWSPPEPWGDWSVGPEAHIVLQSDTPPMAPLSLSIRAHALPWIPTGSQEVQVWIDGKPSVVWHIGSAGDQEYAAPIPPRTSQHQLIDIDFRIQRPFAPKQLGLGNDEHKLGIGLVSFQLQSLPAASASGVAN